MATGTIPYAPKVDVGPNNSILSAMILKSASDSIQITLYPNTTNQIAAGAIQLNFTSTQIQMRAYNGTSWDVIKTWS